MRVVRKVSRWETADPRTYSRRCTECFNGTQILKNSVITCWKQQRSSLVNRMLAAFSHITTCCYAAWNCPQKWDSEIHHQSKPKVACRLGSSSACSPDTLTLRLDGPFYYVAQCTKQRSKFSSGVPYNVRQPWNRNEDSKVSDRETPSPKIDETILSRDSATEANFYVAVLCLRRQGNGEGNGGMLSNTSYHNILPCNLGCPRVRLTNKQSRVHWKLSSPSVPQQVTWFINTALDTHLWCHDHHLAFNEFLPDIFERTVNLP